MPSIEGKPGNDIALMHHSKAKVEENVIDITVEASSVRLPKDTIIALASLRKEMLPLCSLYNTSFHIPLKDKDFEHSDSTALSIVLVLANWPYNARSVLDEVTTTKTFLPLPT